MKQYHANAQPRVSLLGNPSDIYGGFGLGFPIWNWQAKGFIDTSISTSEEIPLLKAARKVFSQYHIVKKKFGLRFISDIPMQAGLAGSRVSRDEFPKGFLCAGIVFEGSTTPPNPG